MKAFTACVLISLVTLSVAIKNQYHVHNVTRDGYITLNVTIDNTTWTRYHLNKWHQICTWSDPSYKCHSNGSITIHAFNITSGQYKAESFTNWFRYYGNHKHEIHIFNITVIEHPTTKAPTTANTATSIKSTTEQTEATSSAFSSTANLTSLAWTNETGVSLMNHQPFSGLDIQITFLVVCGIFILVVLLYFVCCKAREKSRRPIYRPVIGEPQPLQVEGGLRNLLFSFSVW
ncbi:hypothetical protein [Human adenovirus 64]|nr:hypothetical protein [Human adenovirus 64]WOZ25001.1 hypothetical protein [Human adenovirus 64]